MFGWLRALLGPSEAEIARELIRQVRLRQEASTRGRLVADRNAAKHIAERRTHSGEALNFDPTVDYLKGNQ